MCVLSALLCPNWDPLQVKKVMVNRVSVSETAATERDQEYIDKNAELADTRKEMDSIKQIQLDAAKQFKEAAINRRLAAEAASRKQSIEERIEADATALAIVKETIEKNKAAQKATKEKIDRTAKERQDKVKQESKAFQDTMQRVFEERATLQKREIAERAEKRRLADIALSKKRAALEAEQLAEQKRAEAAQRALMTTLRAETFREEQLRKMEDEARKEASRYGNFDIVFGTRSPSFLSSAPSRTRRALCSAWCPCSSGADWCLQSDVCVRFGFQGKQGAARRGAAAEGRGQPDRGGRGEGEDAAARDRAACGD